jgi:hypothetical protein
VVDPQEAVLAVLAAFESVYREVRHEVVVVAVIPVRRYRITPLADDLILKALWQHEIVGVRRLYRLEKQFLSASGSLCRLLRGPLVGRTLFLALRAPGQDPRTPGDQRHRARPKIGQKAAPAHPGRRWLYVQVAFLLLYLLRTWLFTVYPSFPSSLHPC